MNGRVSCPFLEKKMDTKISIHNQGTALGESHSPFGEEEMPCHDDAQWFSDAMNNPHATNKSALASGATNGGAVDSTHNIGTQFLNKVADMSEDLKAKSDHLGKRFKTASTSNDFTDMMQTLREISDYGFQTAMVTKVVSKSTQALEKLTNLN
jgi:type III secretion system YscI/HrpB-like protein